jgi:acyl-CoA synthetase (AMP-forming)/AMP-acid ligase II
VVKLAAHGLPPLPPDVAERTVPQMLRRAAAEATERSALIAHSLLDGGEITLSYGELARRCRRMATVLRDHGVRRGDRVALVIANDGAIEAHLAYHAVHHLGAINVPINTFYVEREFEYVLKFVAPRAIVFAPIFGDAVAASVGGGDPPALLAVAHQSRVGEPLGALLEMVSEEAAPAELQETDEADWIFTSGTTGHPKAVALSHAACVACGHEAISVWGLDADSVYQNSSPFFTSTGCHTNLLACLAAGCTFVIDPEVDAQAIFDRAVQRGTTSMFVLTAILAILFRRLDDGRLKSLDVPSLKRLFYGGQTMPKAFHERLEREFAAQRGIELGVVYGLTEGGTSGVMLEPADHAEAVRRHGSYGLSIGRRGWNEWVEHRIVGEDGEDAAPDEVGEIWLRAPSVMTRYVDNEQATEKALAGGWLHTGDMAMADADGFIYFVDRAKSMIRRGGMNIAAAEVEAVALVHPEVVEVAAIGRANPVLGEDVHLIVVVTAEAELTGEQLIGFCRERLAEYKVPRTVSFTDALPRNAMGKVARSQLTAEATDGEAAPR